MKSVTIPANVTLIARNTFDGCDLEQVYWNAENCTRGNYEGQDFYYTLFYKNNNLSTYTGPKSCSSSHWVPVKQSCATSSIVPEVLNPTLP